MQPTAGVAAFDFDGTLTDSGSVFDFLIAVAGATAVLSAAAVLAPRLARAAVLGGSHADRTKEVLFERVLSGEPLDEVTRVSERFARAAPGPSPTALGAGALRPAPRPG